MTDYGIEIRSFTGGMAQTNGYLLGSSKNDGSCILIDAPLGVSDWLDSLNETPTSLLLTHQHYDHIEDAAKLAAKGLKIYAYANYAQSLTLELLLQQSGIPIEISPYSVDNVLEGQSELEAGGITFKLEHVPGHSLDSIVFVHGDLVFGGDTLFAGGIGRADLPDGDMNLLVQGIKEKILTLPSSSSVFPGHGPSTTIEDENATNPFL